MKDPNINVFSYRNDCEAMKIMNNEERKSLLTVILLSTAVIGAVAYTLNRKGCSLYKENIEKNREGIEDTGLDMYLDTGFGCKLETPRPEYKRQQEIYSANALEQKIVDAWSV